MDRSTSKAVEEAVRGHSPDSIGRAGPTEDGVPAALYHVFADIFVPIILMKMEHLARTGKWGEGWARGIMRTIPKEAGNLAVEKQRPMTLLNAKAKWITGTMKICLQHFLNVVVPMEQKGFMKGRNMDAHLYNVMYIPASYVKGAWVSIDFLKAYDKMRQQIIEALLHVAGMQRQWMRMLITFMEEELGFLVTNKVADRWVRPRGGKWARHPWHCSH